MQRLLFYLRMFRLFWMILWNSSKFTSFLNRKQRLGSGANRLLAKPLDRRKMEERKGRSIMSREDFFCSTFIDATREAKQESFRQELELPIYLLVIWYCEKLHVTEETEEE